MGTVALRLNDRDEELIKEYAKAKDISVSKLFRDAVLSHIEDDIDLDLYRTALEAHRNDPHAISFDEMMRDLGADEHQL